MALWHTTYPGVDPDFDEMGGELTLHQIEDPVPEPDQFPVSWTMRQGWKLRYSVKGKREAKHWEQKHRVNELDRRLEKTIDKNLMGLSMRLNNATYRLKHTKNWLDHQRGEILKRRCELCRPYNWHHTPGYWGTGQDDQYRGV